MSSIQQQAKQTGAPVREIVGNDWDFLPDYDSGAETTLNAALHDIARPITSREILACSSAGQLLDLSKSVTGYVGAGRLQLNPFLNQANNTESQDLLIPKFVNGSKKELESALRIIAASKLNSIDAIIALVSVLKQTQPNQIYAFKRALLQTFETERQQSDWAAWKLYVGARPLPRNVDYPVKAD